MVVGKKNHVLVVVTLPRTNLCIERRPYHCSWVLIHGGLRLSYTLPSSISVVHARCMNWTILYDVIVSLHVLCEDWARFPAREVSLFFDSYLIAGIFLKMMNVGGKMKLEISSSYWAFLQLVLNLKSSSLTCINRNPASDTVFHRIVLFRVNFKPHCLKSCESSCIMRVMKSRVSDTASIYVSSFR